MRCDRFTVGAALYFTQAACIACLRSVASLSGGWILSFVPRCWKNLAIRGCLHDKQKEAYGENLSPRIKPRFLLVTNRFDHADRRHRVDG